MGEPEGKIFDPKSATDAQSKAKEAVEKLRSDLEKGDMTVPEAEKLLQDITNGLDATQNLNELLSRPDDNSPDIQY